MNAPNLTLKILSGDPAALDGQVFTIEGRLTSMKVVTIEIKEGSTAVILEIIDPTLEVRMLATCSIWMGGPMFDDLARIVGTLARREDGLLYVSSVKSGTLYQETGDNVF